MDMDLAGRVAKIRLAPNSRNSFLPLFEALVNSIHAIDADKEKQGLIEIAVLRDGFQGVLKIGEGKKLDDAHIHGFEVIDNGIGFDEENFGAFSVADTPFKQNIGGQGIGRPSSTSRNTKTPASLSCTTSPHRAAASTRLPSPRPRPWPGPGA